MIELFRTMLLGVTAAALCVGAALSLARGQALREVIRFAGGLAVLLAVLQPLSQLRLPDIRAGLQLIKEQTYHQRTQYQQQSEQALVQAAVDTVATHIEQRAQQMGASCEVTLTTIQDTQGTTQITGAQMDCAPKDQMQAAELAQMVTECGIPKELQRWTWTNTK